MRTRKLFVLPGLVAVVCALAFVAFGPAARTTHAANARGPRRITVSTPSDIGTACLGWTVVPSPNVISESNQLQTMAATSPSDIWAVGSANSSGSPVTWKSLIEHWNGEQWSIIPSPNPSSADTQLQGIAAISSSDAWAVGFANDSQGNAKTLTEQWNGSAWSVVTSPNSGSGYNELAGAAAVSASDVWAVGSYVGTNIYGDAVNFTLIEHWDGTKWSIVSSPSQGQNGSALVSVAALSSTNVWAVGYYYNNTDTPQTLIEQWNGTQWSIVASPNAGSDTQANNLSDLVAVSANNVWAVGGYEYTNSPTFTYNPLTELWNGTSWNLVSSPARGTQGSSLSGAAVVPRTGGHLVAVGSYGAQNGLTNVYQPLVERWDGSHWSVYSSYVQPEFDAALTAVVAFGSTNMWAIGISYPLGSPAQTLILHYHTFHTYGRC